MRKPKKTPKTVKLLLNESVRALGRVGDVVTVSPGYARNLLIPHHLAVKPTPSNLARVEEKRKEVLRQEALKREEQAALLKKLEGFEVSVERRANETGHLFGSVTASDIATELQAKGHEIAAEEVALANRIDEVGDYEVEIIFADDLRGPITLHVQPDAESKAGIDEYQAEQKARREAEEAAEAEQKARLEAAAAG
jgi:large subunit ribosomal protein L9